MISGNAGNFSGIRSRRMRKFAPGTFYWNNSKRNSQVSSRNLLCGKAEIFLAPGGKKLQLLNKCLLNFRLSLKIWKEKNSFERWKNVLKRRELNLFEDKRLFLSFFCGEANKNPCNWTSSWAGRQQVKTSLWNVFN